jgi:hypothetical protein
MFHVPEKFRLIRLGLPHSGNQGAFRVPLSRSQTLLVVASAAEGWEHVSVSRKDRTPHWEEMCHIKALFWDEEDVVVQFHPAKSDYVNNHPRCLHLWRPIGIELPRPDPLHVGLPGVEPDEFQKMIGIK